LVSSGEIFFPHFWILGSEYTLGTNYYSSIQFMDTIIVILYVLALFDEANVASLLNVNT